MISVGLLATALVSRAAVVGVFGGAGLALTSIYSRRGPLVYPVYAALLAALALLTAGYSSVSYAGRLIGVFVGFAVASAVLYVTTGILAQQVRRRLVAEARLPESALTARLSLLGHAWRMGVMVGLGLVASAGVAFVAVAGG